MVYNFKLFLIIVYGSSDSLQRNRFYKHLTIAVSTVSNIPVDVTVRVEEQTDFYIKDNYTYSVTISPSQPKYFYYKYDENEDLENANTVILEVDSNDETCLTVSIQNSTVRLNYRSVSQI